MSFNSLCTQIKRDIIFCRFHTKMRGVAKNRKLYLEGKMIDLATYLFFFYQVFRVFLNVQNLKKIKMLFKNQKIPIFAKLAFYTIFDVLKHKNRLT